MSRAGCGSKTRNGGPRGKVRVTGSQRSLLTLLPTPGRPFSFVDERADDRDYRSLEWPSVAGLATTAQTTLVEPNAEADRANRRRRAWADSGRRTTRLGVALVAGSGGMVTRFGTGRTVRRLRIGGGCGRAAQCGADVHLLRRTGRSGRIRLARVGLSHVHRPGGSRERRRRRRRRPCRPDAERGR